MIKIFILIFSLLIFCFPQLNNNGVISLVYNSEKIELPINKISLNKDDGIVLSIGAEKQAADVQQSVVLNIGLNKLSKDVDAVTLDKTKIKIKTKDNRTDSGKEISVWFEKGESNDFKNQSETIHYGIYSKGENVSWEINSVSLKIEITELQLENGVMHIKGRFNGEFKSNAASPEHIAKLEDGEFDIIF